MKKAYAGEEAGVGLHDIGNTKEAPRMSVSRQVFIIGKNDYTMKKYLKRTKNQTTFA